MSEVRVHHGSRERISWTVSVYDDLSPHPSASHKLFGDREAEARADFARRSKYLHKGKTIRLERLVTVRSWIHANEAIEAVTK